MSDRPKRDRSVAKPKSISPPQSRSIKEFSACLLCAADSLGRYIPVVGGQVKGSVIKSLVSNTCPHRSSSSPAVGVSPSFNRMSGIQEYSNCVCLFLNVFGCSYGNSWSEQRINNENRLVFTWFAQPSQTAESNSIKRIIQLSSIKSESESKSRNTNSSSSNTPSPLFSSLLLYCRLLNDSYVFCGSLKYLSSNINIRPMKFEFALMESNQLEMKNSAPVNLLMEAAMANGRVELNSVKNEENENIVVKNESIEPIIEVNKKNLKNKRNIKNTDTDNRKSIVKQEIIEINDIKSTNTNKRMKIKNE